MLAGAFALSLVAGCGDDNGGGGGGASDEQDIEAVVVRALTTTDPDVKCVETVTETFVSTVYGSLATCKKAETPKPDDSPKPTGANASSVKVDGDEATAIITVEGGPADGSSGELSFAKEDGEWKVQDLGVGFLRSQLTTTLTHPDAEDAKGPLGDAKVQTCIVRAFDAVSDTELRTIAFEAIRDAPPNAKFVEIFTTCTTNATDATDATDDTSTTSSDDSDEVPSLLRSQFESGIRQAAKKDGATDEQIDCVVKKLRVTISEDDIVAAIGKGSDSGSDLAQRTARAIQQCG